MRIELPEEAKKYFNERASDFLHELKPDKTSQRKRVSVESSASHVFISEHLTERDVDISTLGYADPISGRQVARFFFVENVPIGLDQEVFGKFEEFIEKVQRRREVSPFLSRDFLMDCAFDYFEKRYKGILREHTDLVSFFIRQAEGAIKPYKVSIPISFMAIQRPFDVGSVTFEYFTKDFFDQYTERTKSSAVQDGTFDEKKFHVFERRFREKYQGAVFTSAIIEAEKRRSIEIARSETEKALRVLRFFAPSALVPQIPCYFAMMGHTHIAENHTFVFEEDTPAVVEETDEKRKCRWDLSADNVRELFDLGLSTASGLLLKKKLSEFEELTLNCMSLFGRCLTSLDFQDKIVYALVSIETLLLRNETEPIQSNLGLKLAFLTKSKPQERKKVKDLVTKAYKIRSAYVHHGKRAEDWKILEDLQHTIWTAIRSALLSSAQFPAQKDFLDRLERIILS